MSLDYAMILTLGTRKPKAATSEFVKVAQLPLSSAIKQERGRIQLDALAFWGTLGPAGDYSEKLERKRFGIDVDSDLIMRPPNTDDWRKNVAAMLHFATVVMQQTTGDCAMTQETTTFFVRRKGVVYLNTHPDLEWPQGASLVGAHRVLSLGIDEPFPLAKLSGKR